MLPDIRAVVAALVAAVGLMTIAFSVAATYRVAQENQSGLLQADLRRTRVMVPANQSQRPVAIIDTPGPHLAPKATPIEGVPTLLVEVAAPLEPPPAPLPPVRTAVVQSAPLRLEITQPAWPPVENKPVEPLPLKSAQAEPPQLEPLQLAAPQAPPPVDPPQAAGPVAVSMPLAEPPIGGPLAEPPRAQPETSRSAAAGKPSRADTRALQRAAAAKAKARAARVVRERKAAARRAAQVRRAKQRAPAPTSTSSFQGSFGGTFTTPNAPRE